MLVIVEGPDGSGKSTLCKELEIYGYKILRRERFSKNFSIDEFLKLQRLEERFVIDRALLTPWAYRLLDNGELDNDDFTINTIIDLLSKSITIYCTCKSNFKYSILRGETNICTLEKSTKLRTIYDFIVQTIRLYKIGPIYDYDFEKQNINDVLNFIMEVKDGIR